MFSSDPIRHVDYSKQEEPGFWLRALQRMKLPLHSGRLTIQTPSGQRIEYGDPATGPDALLVMHKWRTVRRVMLGGCIGFAEAFVDGDWSSPDLTKMIEWAARNVDDLERMMAGFYPVRMFNRLTHTRRENTPRGSRHNISAHYDLGNEFYRLWLDRSMTYSSALYTRPGQSLDEAQRAKYSEIFKRLNLSGGERVLEIGCGWGSLAKELTERHDCHVTGLTLSSEQLAYAQAQLDKAGKAGSADLRLQDYRKVEGTFDRIVSIEMIEAVGEKYWPVYFDTIRERLTPGGTAVVQAITIDHARFDQYSKGVDFIQKYIFPGGMLLSKEIMQREATRAGLILQSVENFGESYARTLAEWRTRFQTAWPRIGTLGFDTRFKLMWEYYLSYCEAGFRASSLDVGLYSLVRPA